MPKRRKPRKPAPRRSHGPSAVFDSEQQLVLARSIRSSCTECPSTHLHWGDVAGGMFGARTDRQRAHFVEAVTDGLDSTWSAWWCMDCEAVGIFQPMEALF